MGIETAGQASAQEELSALIDGELSEAGVAQTCQRWRSDTDLRASWHAYHLIGDVLRSDDLCSTARRDADFLAAVRTSLAKEPVVLAPRSIDEGVSTHSVARHVGARRTWRTPVAVAAGFMAVVGVVVVTRLTSPAPDTGIAEASNLPISSTTTAAPTPLNPALQAVAATVPLAAADARGMVASGQLIRDVRLDRYLSAHKQFAGSSALGVPSGFLRNATADAADR